MRVVSSRSVVDRFEARILDALARAPGPDGLATNNVIIPHVKFRNLPNEHDLLVFTEGKVYTLDGKGLEPGSYRGSGGGGWEYSRDGLSWEPVTFMTHPEEVAFKKARVTEGYLRSRLPADNSIPMPQVISVIVVPDEADVSGLAWGAAGTATGARLLLTRLGDLAACLDADDRAHRQRRPTVDELAALFHVERPNAASALPCYLSPHLRVDAFLGHTVRPWTGTCTGASTISCASRCASRCCRSTAVTSRRHGVCVPSGRTSSCCRNFSTTPCFACTASTIRPWPSSWSPNSSATSACKTSLTSAA